MSTKAQKSQRTGQASRRVIRDSTKTIWMWSLKTKKSKSIHPPTNLLSPQIQVAKSAIQTTEDDPSKTWSRAIASFFGHGCKRFFDKVTTLTPGGQEEQVQAFPIVLFNFRQDTGDWRTLCDCCDLAVAGKELTALLRRRFTYTIYSLRDLLFLADEMREGKERVFRGVPFEPQNDLLVMVHVAAMKLPFRAEVGIRKGSPFGDDDSGESSTGDDQKEEKKREEEEEKEKQEEKEERKDETGRKKKRGENQEDQKGRSEEKGCISEPTRAKRPAREVQELSRDAKDEGEQGAAPTDDEQRGGEKIEQASAFATNTTVEDRGETEDDDTETPRRH